jgi:hypothetical protein
MLTVMVCALMFGVCLLIGSATSLGRKMSENHERASVHRTPLTAVAAWRPGAARVAAVGWTAPGPAGPQTAPLSGRECAWYATSLIRTPSRRQDDGDTGEDILWTMTSPAAPALLDSSGGVLIDPRMLVEAPNLYDPVATKSALRTYERMTASTAPRFVPRQHVADVRGYESLRLRETWLPIGVEVYALGAVGRDGAHAMLRPRSGLTVFTTDRRGEVIERRRTEAIESRKLGFFLGRIGLVVTLIAGVLVWWKVS